MSALRIAFAAIVLLASSGGARAASVADAVMHGDAEALASDSSRPCFARLGSDNRNIEGGDYPTRRPDMDHLDYIKLLLAKGADPNLRMKSSTETRTIFTHQWVEGVTFEWSPEQTLEVVKLLLELGADVNAQDTLDYRTALMGAAHKGRNDVVQLLVDHGAKLDTRDIGSRDSIHALAGVTWQAIDYADGLVRVGVQSAIAHPETAALMRTLMQERGLPVPPEGRTLESICITDVCK